jgi:sec-independent protein translocase protein TatC
VADVEVVGGPAADRGLPPGQLTSGPAESPAEPADKVMSLVDHLAELRRRLVISAAAILAGSVLGFYVAPQAIQLLARPILRDGPLIFLDVGGAFFLQLRIAVMIGFALAVPVVLHQLWAFVAPGLTPEERRVARPWIPFAILFFALGVAVAYVALPFTAAFLLSFQIPGVVEPMISADRYFGFVTIMFLAFGVVMQFPIVLVLLTKLRILSLARLRASRRYVFLGMFVFSMVVTPGGDPFSMLIMGLVMYALYELTLVVLSRQQRGSVVADD